MPKRELWRHEGIDARVVALDTVAFTVRFRLWRWCFIGHYLWREGMLVNESCRDWKAAVRYAKAWEDCVSHEERMKSMPSGAYHDALERAREVRNRWLEEEDKAYE